MNHCITCKFFKPYDDKTVGQCTCPLLSVPDRRTDYETPCNGLTVESYGDTAVIVGPEYGCVNHAPIPSLKFSDLNPGEKFTVKRALLPAPLMKIQNHEHWNCLRADYSLGYVGPCDEVERVTGETGNTVEPAKQYTLETLPPFTAFNFAPPDGTAGLLFKRIDTYVEVYNLDNVQKITAENGIERVTPYRS